jgi:hypothetical protein
MFFNQTVLNGAVKVPNGANSTTSTVIFTNGAVVQCSQKC